MPLITAKVKTWRCDKYPSECPFGLELGVDPHELTPEQWSLHFPGLPGLMPGHCPNCYAKGVFSDLSMPDDPADLSTITVASDEELDAIQKDDLDENGDPIMIESDILEDVIVNDNGNARFEQRPVMVRKQRGLTEEERAAYGVKQQQALDTLQTNTVQEVSEEADPGAV